MANEFCQVPNLSLGRNTSYVMIIVLYLYVPHFPEAEVCHLFFSVKTHSSRPLVVRFPLKV